LSGAGSATSRISTGSEAARDGFDLLLLGPVESMVEQS
jgi:hypothetical protein